ncbi:MAG: MoxR family ATPase, partial [Acidimicrobiia bacterium]|nr:MoxR family ATPase [Acidimicrobiia bacterium]
IEEEAAILDQRAATGATVIGPVVDIDEIRSMIDLAGHVHVAPAVSRYVVAITAASRALPEIRLGASPRASLALLRAAQAHALLDGRTYVVPHDVKALAGPVLAHRLVLAAEAEVEGRVSEEVLEGLVASVPAPSGR